MIPVQLSSLVAGIVETSTHSSSPLVLLFSCSFVLHIALWPVFFKYINVFTQKCKYNEISQYKVDM